MNPPYSAEAYEGVVEENASLKRRIKELEKACKKRKKREPNAYQQEWKRQYPIEVAHAKTEHATCPKESWLQKYSKVYGDNMTTAPNPKHGEPLEKEDRGVFMKNISARAKRANAIKGQQEPAPALTAGSGSDNEETEAATVDN